MSFLDVLKQYTNATPGQSLPNAADHFDQVAQSAPPEVLAQGISAALQSDHTPPFGQMVGQTFQRADPQQQAGMLNQLLGALGPGGLAGLAGGALGKFLPSGSASITPDQAATLSPQQVQQVAADAEQQNPTIVDRMGAFYAQHPMLVKTLGSAALTIALAKMSNNMRR